MTDGLVHNAIINDFGAKVRKNIEKGCKKKVLLSYDVRIIKKMCK